MQIYFLELNTESRTRGHNMKLKKKSFKFNSRKFFFSQRIIGDWNNLHQEAVNSTTLLGFKKIIGQWVTNGLKKPSDPFHIPD